MQFGSYMTVNFQILERIGRATQQLDLNLPSALCRLRRLASTSCRYSYSFSVQIYIMGLRSIREANVFQGAELARMAVERKV